MAIATAEISRGIHNGCSLRLSVANELQGLIVAN
jgi:hypothetical protein